MKVAKKLAWATFVAALLVLPSISAASASTPVTSQPAVVSHANTGATCRNASAASAPTDRLANAQTMAPSEVLSLPGGGQDYVYYIQGYKTEYYVPPIGFNPLNATDAQLKEYGFQPRPTGDIFQLKQWEEEMSHWKQTPVPKQLVLPASAQRYHKRHEVSASTSNYNTSYSGNWSGYENLVSSNVFVGAQGDFVQPTPASTVCYNPDESAWVGIGGNTASAGLIQAGTDMNFGGTPKAWYEYVGPNNTGVPEQFLSQITVHPGDHMHVYVSYQTSTGQANFYVADNTTGTSQPVNITLSSSFYNGATAEWIDEAPSDAYGNIEPLINYQNDAWTNAQSYNTSGVWNSITAYSYQPLYLTDTGTSTGTVQSAASTLTTSTSWTDYWHSCN